MNIVFFASVFVTAAIMELVIIPSPFYVGWEPLFPEVAYGTGFILFLGIFLSNLFLSSLFFLTFTGFLLFPASFVLLAVRGFLWATLVAFMPTSLLLLALPVVLLEGEAYAVAALAGTVLGVSWMKPKWLYKEEGIGRFDSWWRGLSECGAMYIVVASFLFAAAIIGTYFLFGH